MKKYFILTSVLALAACGGGSGGGHNAPGAPIVPTDSLTPEQRAAAIASNAEITDMESFIVIGGNNPTVNSNSRHAHGGTKLHDGGVRYDLSNVEFKTASTILNTDMDERALVRFKTENGRIDKIEIVNSGLTAIGERVNNTNEFDGNFTLENGDEFEEGPMAAMYDSYGKKHKLGLRYSDFGMTSWGEGIGRYDTTNYFAGGYERKEIASGDIDGKMEFNALADATISIGEWNDYEDYDNLDNLETTADATVVFENGTTTVTANFDNWYDVTATMDDTGELTNLVFANGDKEGFHTSDENDFKWHGENEYTAKPTAVIDSNIPGCDDCKDIIVRDGFVQYYGDNGTPAEVVGVIRYGDTQGASQGSLEQGNLHSAPMRFDMGFGGTVKK